MDLVDHLNTLPAEVATIIMLMSADNASATQRVFVKVRRLSTIFSAATPQRGIGSRGDLLAAMCTHDSTLQLAAAALASTRERYNPMFWYDRIAESENVRPCDLLALTRHMLSSMPSMEFVQAISTHDWTDDDGEVRVNTYYTLMRRLETHGTLQDLPLAAETTSILHHYSNHYKFALMPIMLEQLPPREFVESCLKLYYASVRVKWPATLTANALELCSPGKSRGARQKGAAAALLARPSARDETWIQPFARFDDFSDLMDRPELANFAAFAVILDACLAKADECGEQVPMDSDVDVSLLLAGVAREVLEKSGCGMAAEQTPTMRNFTAERRANATAVCPVCCRPSARAGISFALSSSAMAVYPPNQPPRLSTDQRGATQPCTACAPSVHLCAACFSHTTGAVTLNGTDVTVSMCNECALRRCTYPQDWTAVFDWSAYAQKWRDFDATTLQCSVCEDTIPASRAHLCRPTTFMPEPRQQTDYEFDDFSRIVHYYCTNRCNTCFSMQTARSTSFCPITDEARCLRCWKPCARAGCTSEVHVSSAVRVRTGMTRKYFHTQCYN